MNRVFKPYLDMFIVIFIDDILVYLWDVKENDDHLWIILQTLRDRQFFSKYNKCGLLFREVALLRHIVSGDGIRVDSKKIEVVKNWPTPLSPSNIMSFLNLAG